MPKGKNDWLRELQQTYLERADVKLSELSKALEAVLNNKDRFEDRDKLHRLLHNMAGSGASFGFKEISIVARAMLEDFHTAHGSSPEEIEQYNKKLREDLSAIKKTFKKAKSEFEASQI